MKRLTLLFTWLVVTAGATAVAWTTVGRLTPGAAGGTPRAMSSGAVDAALRDGKSPATLPPVVSVPPDEQASGSAAAPAPGAADTPAPGPVPTTVPANRPPAGASSPAPATATAPRPGATATTVSPSSSGPGPSGSGGSGSGSSPTSTTTSTTVAARSSVIESTGGVVTVSCRGSTISLVSSSPRNGYSQEIENTGPEEVVVKYRSSDHQSEIKAVCENGTPHAEVNESGEN